MSPREGPQDNLATEGTRGVPGICQRDHEVWGQNQLVVLGDFVWISTSNRIGAADSWACMSKCQQLEELGSMNSYWKDWMLESPNFSQKSHEWISILPYRGQGLDKATGTVCIHMSAKSVWLSVASLCTCVYLWCCICVFSSMSTVNTCSCSQAGQTWGHTAVCKSVFRISVWQQILQTVEKTIRVISLTEIYIYIFLNTIKPLKISELQGCNYKIFQDQTKIIPIFWLFSFVFPQSETAYNGLVWITESVCNMCVMQTELW